MFSATPAKSSSRLKRALLKSQSLTSVPIEVLIYSNTTCEGLTRRIEALTFQGLLTPGQAIIGVDPVHRHVAIALSAEIQGELDTSELQAWLKGLQEDLHMTCLENAVGLAVLSLAMAFSGKFPPRSASE